MAEPKSFEPSPRQAVFMALAALMLASFLGYSNSLYGMFVWDDLSAVLGKYPHDGNPQSPALGPAERAQNPSGYFKRGFIGAGQTGGGA